MKKKIICLMMSLAMAATVLTSCAKPPEKPVESAPASAEASAPAQESAPASEASSTGAKELRFLDVSPNPTRQKYYEDTFKKFEAETGIKVVYESVPWDDAANRISVLGASNQLPDVFNVWEGWIGQYKTAGWISPLTDYIAPTRDSFTSAAELVNKTQEEVFGNVYSIPDGMMVKGIYYRKDWVQELGIEIKEDWTYDDYFALMGKLTDKEKKRYGVSYRGARGAFDPISTYLQSLHGGDMYDADGNILINDEKAVEGFKKWTDAYLNGYAPKDAINWGFVELVDNFAGGLTGTLLNDSEVAATLTERMKPEQWGVLPIPTSADGKIYNTFGSPYAYAISGNSKAKDESWKLIEFLVRPDNNIEYCKMGGLIPIKKDVANDPTFGPDGPYAVFVKQLNSPNIALPAKIGQFDFTDMHQGMMHEEVQKYLLGKQSAEDALGHITSELEKRMKDYMKEHPGEKPDMAKTLN